MTILSINMIWTVVNICLFYYNFHTNVGIGRWLESQTNLWDETFNWSKQKNPLYIVLKPSFSSWLDQVLYILFPNILPQKKHGNSLIRRKLSSLQPEKCTLFVMFSFYHIILFTIGLVSGQLNDDVRVCQGKTGYPIIDGRSYLVQAKSYFHF